MYLAIDQGSHASRALVFDTRGRLRASASAAIATQRPRPGWVEHDPVELLAATRQVVREAAAGLTITAAGLATQRSSIACWERGSGRVLAPVISWQDRRAADWLAAYQEHAPRIREITGLLLSPHYGVSKLRWCLDHLPAVTSAAADGALVFGPLSSLVCRDLCDADLALADPANASRTLLWDHRQRDWSDELLARFGLRREYLPASVPTRHAFGRLHDGGAPLQIVTGDQSAALFGYGEPDPDTVYVNLGTGAFLQQLAAAPPPADSGLLSSVVYQDAERARYVQEGTVNGAGAAITTLASQLGLDPPSVEAASADWLGSIGQPPLFLNGVGGLGSPWWRSEFRSRFVGEGQPAEKLVAVFESILFLIMSNLERFRMQRPVTRLLASGGLARLAPLMQKLANLGDLPVEVPAMPEATARGVAFLLAGAPAAWAAPDRQRYLPAPDPDLAARYRQWRELLDAALNSPSA